MRDLVLHKAVTCSLTGEKSYDRFVGTRPAESNAVSAEARAPPAVADSPVRRHHRTPQGPEQLLQSIPRRPRLTP
jgi:hypothetical protein